MKFLFLNMAYPQECYEKIMHDARGALQVPSNVFQWAVINGLERNNVDYCLVSVPALPAWPRYRHFFSPKGNMTVNGLIKGLMLRYCDAPLLKQVSQRRILRDYIKNWYLDNEGNNPVVLIYTQQSELLGAAIDVKDIFPRLKVIPIITDLIENAFDFKSNNTFLKRMQIKIEAKEEHRLFPKVDNFVLLTEQMTEFIPEAIGRSIVVEGIAPSNNINLNFLPKSDKTRSILYTGALEEYAGIRVLVDAFRGVKITDVRLIICGNGGDADYVKQAANEDDRIVYRGRVDHEEAIRLQKECTLLINPRQPNGGITKYSFPSKTMEYMSSGTPMIGYHLEGIPEEYHEHMYSPSDLTVKSLARCIENTIALPSSELYNKAVHAARFISECKSSKAQVKKILDFINQ